MPLCAPLSEIQGKSAVSSYQFGRDIQPWTVATFLTKPAAKASAQQVPCALIMAGAHLSVCVGAICISPGKCHRLHALGQVLLCLLLQFRGELATLPISDPLPTSLRAM